MNYRRLMNDLTARQRDSLLLSFLKSVDQLDNDVEAGDKTGGLRRHMVRESVAIQSAEQWLIDAGK